MHPDSNPEKKLQPQEREALERLNQKLSGEINAFKNALKISADEYKKVFDQLKEIEQRNSALAENSYDLICEISTIGRFLYVSPNFKAVLGYEPDELLNQPFTDLLHPDEQNEVRRIFKKAIAGLSVQQVLTRIRHANGDWFWFESAGTGFKSISGEVRVVVISRNVNQRRLMEDELLKAQKLDSLGILAGGIAHDFNNLLTAIMVNISTASMDIPAEDDKYYILKEAKNACLQAKELTQQLLTFSKSGSPLKKTTSIITLIKNTVDFTLRGSNVKCEYHLPDGLMAVDVDEIQISQVINNIVLNSVQAMPEGGNIDMFAENVEITKATGLPLHKGSYVKMVFRDSGAGISRENMSKVFDPYFTTKFDGSGLGLSISYSIIKNHGGLLTLESTEGVGTSVTLYLPVSRPAMVKAAHEKGRDEPRTGFGKILIMDDEEIIRISLGKMLQRLGYEVTLSQNSEEAFQIYQDNYMTGNKFDLVIVDLTVPGGKGGKKMVELLREFDKDAKAVVASGYSNHPVLLNYKKYGFVEVLKKPFEIEDVSLKIHKLIGDDRGM